MSFTATCIGGPLDGLTLEVRNPPLPPDTFWGTRCPSKTCKLARLLRNTPGEEQRAPEAQEECDVQRSHWFENDPVAFGIKGCEKYRRIGVKRNVHVYQTDNTIIGPGEAIYSDPQMVPVPS